MRILAESALIESKVTEIGALDDVVGFHIRLAHGKVNRHFTETFSDLGLTQKQVSALWLVGDHPAIAQIEVGQRLQMDRATTMTIINRLQERGLVRRKPSQKDGRKQCLYLTPCGREALAEARSCIESHEAWLKSRFTTDEVKKLVELLARIHE